MERKKANYRVKKEAQRLYEVEGLSDKNVGERLGFHQSTISTWRKNEGWGPRGEGTTEPSTFDADGIVSHMLANDGVETVGAPEDFDGNIPTATNEDEVAVLKQRIADLETEVETFRPDVDISMMLFKNEADLEVIFDEQYWKDRAQLEFRSENIQRRKDGLEILAHTDDELVSVIHRLKEEELSSRNKVADGPPDKRIKMVKPNKDGTYYPPHIVQLPYESQVNNVAGSLADGLVVYTSKGYKLTSPFLCPRRKCFTPCATDADNNWIFDGYCSDEHRIEVEKPSNSPVPGVTVRDVIGSLTR